MEEARGDAGLRALLVAGAGLLLLAGCGEDKHKAAAKTERTTTPAPTVAVAPQGPPLSKSEYETRVKATVQRLENSPPLDAPEDASLEQQADVLDEGLDRVRSLGAALGKLNPPAAIRTAHVNLVNGLRDTADDGERVVGALRAGNQDEANRLVNGQFLRPKTIREIRSARAEFKRQGYDLGQVSQFP